MWTEALSKYLSPVDRAWATKAMSLCCHQNKPPAWLCFSDIQTSTGGSGSRKGLASGWLVSNCSTMSVRIVSIFLPPRTWRHNANYWLEGTTSVFCHKRADPKPVEEHPSVNPLKWVVPFLLFQRFSKCTVLHLNIHPHARDCISSRSVSWCLCHRPTQSQIGISLYFIIN